MSDESGSGSSIGVPVRLTGFTTRRTYFNRIRTVYAGRKDFYALDYDMDEVIDAASLVVFRPRSSAKGSSCTHSSGPEGQRCQVHQPFVFAQYRGSKVPDGGRWAGGVRDWVLGVEGYRSW